MPRLSMEDMSSAPPSSSELAHLAIQKQKQDRLMMKEERLAQTEARLERQRKDAARKERQRRSAEGQIRAQENARAQELEKKAWAEVSLKMDVVYAIEAASKATGFPVSDEQSQFLVQFMVQLKRAKVI